MSRSILFLCLFIIGYSHAVDVIMSKRDGSAFSAGAGICYTKNNGVRAYGGGTNKCKVNLEADELQSSGYDYISRASVKLPSQIKVDNNNVWSELDCTSEDDKNNDRCIKFSVNAGDDFLCDSIVPSGLYTTEDKIDKFAHEDGLSVAGEGTTSCSIIPKNSKFIGRAELVATFTRTDQTNQGVQDKMKVKILLEYVPSEHCEGGCFGNVKDTLQDAKSQLVHKTAFANGEPHLYKNAEGNLQKIGTSAEDFKSADGALIEYIFNLHYIESRYKITDEYSHQLLPNKVLTGLTYTLAGLDLSSAYNKISNGRSTYENVTLDDFTKVEYQSGNYDGATCAETFAGGDCEITAGEYPQYKINQVVHISYSGLKHIKSSYLGCSNCDSSFTLKGDGIADVSKNIESKLENAQWSIFIPRLTVTAKKGKVNDLDVTSDVNPTHGLYVLPTADSSTDPDGVPLSDLFEVGDRHAWDEFGSYEDPYELMSRLSIKSTNGNNVAEKFMGDESSDASDKTCSSKPGSDAGYGQGKVYDIGSGTKTKEMYEQAFATCRLWISGNFNDQILITWKDDEQVNCGTTIARDDAGNAGDHRCSERQQDVGTYTADDGTTPGKREQVKLTVNDNNVYRIGATELSLLRRQEISAGDGSTNGLNGHDAAVDGQDISFVLYGPATTFDIYGTSTMIGYKNDATPCTDGDVSNNVGCYEVHGCTNSAGKFVDEGATSCAEKIIVSATTGTAHTIRSSEKCAGRMDIQLREQVNAANYLKTTYSFEISIQSHLFVECE